MIVGIDGNEANQKIRAGSGVFAYSLIKEFAGLKDKLYKWEIYLKDKPYRDFPKDDNFLKYKIITPRYLWTQFALPFTLYKEKLQQKSPDIFLSLTHFAPRFCPVPSIITIFDIAYIRFPEMFKKNDLYKLKMWTNYSIKRATKIITISEYSKKEIIDYYQIPKDKIIVVYPGYDQSRFHTGILKETPKIKSVLEKYKINNPFILYIGTVQPRKNLIRLLEAFRNTKRVDPLLKLVIAGMINEGRGGWMTDNFFQTIRNLKLEKEIIITGYVPDEEIPYLLANSKVFVMPSLYEGFGIPVIEAMATGIPTLISNKSSLPEIASNASLFFNPEDENDMTSGLTKILGDENLRNNLILKGLENCRKFTWKNSTENVLNILKNI